MVIAIFKQILVTVYCWPVLLLVLLTVLLISAVMLLILHFCSEKNKDFAGVVMLLLSAFFILAVTLLSRDMGEGSELSLMPFSSWINYFKGSNNEYLRTNVFNILLFMPFGAAFYAVGFSDFSPKTRTIIVTVSAFVLSVAVEAGQFYLQCGEAETDDVIHNTLGAFLGALLAKYLFVLYEKKIKPILCKDRDNNEN